MAVLLSAQPNLPAGILDELSKFCQEMLAHLPRSDQRRWGEVYVRGLVSLPGRKSIKRMADHIVGGPAEQGIQQFLNQSPWDWAPVRRNLAVHAESLFRPRAWVVDEAVIPKNGSNSVGVARQYAPSAGRVLNCQLGLGVFLVGDEGATAANWRLLLPPSWDADATRRARTRIPDGERHRNRWQFLVEALDEMTHDWDLEPAPVVIDARHESDVTPLLHVLGERGYHYLVRVAAGANAATHHLVGAAGRNGVSLNWRDGSDPANAVSRFVLRQLPSQPQPGASWWRSRPRSVLTEWLPGQQRPAGIWMTDLNSLRLPNLISLARTHVRTSAEVNLLRDRFGLNHYEGRSFRGWHHHLTLVSLAHQFVLGQRVGRDTARSYFTRVAPGVDYNGGRTG
jgi:SRSO17 transposase